MDKDNSARLVHYPSIKYLWKTLSFFFLTTKIHELFELQILVFPRWLVKNTIFKLYLNNTNVNLWEKECNNFQIDQVMQASSPNIWLKPIFWHRTDQKLTLRKQCPNSEFFPVRIFSHFVQIRRFPEKNGPGKTSNRDIFHAV